MLIKNLMMMMMNGIYLSGAPVFFFFFFFVSQNYGLLVFTWIKVFRLLQKF